MTFRHPAMVNPSTSPGWCRAPARTWRRGAARSNSGLMLAMVSSAARPIMSRRFRRLAGSPAFYARGGQQFADNLLRFAAKAADEDLYISYVIVHPVDRAKPAQQQAEPTSTPVPPAERNGIVRGAQMLGTGSIMSDYVLVTVILPPQAWRRRLRDLLCVPSGAPGLKLYPRRPYALGPTSVFDYPLSSRFDETDSLAVFDDVFVPWEDVFIYKNLS